MGRAGIGTRRQQLLRDIDISADNMAFAYDPRGRWVWWCDGQEHLKSSSPDGSSSYMRHALDSVLLASQLMVAAIAGFTHAAFACMCPFVAEEVGAELCVIAQHLKKYRDAYHEDDRDDKAALATPVYHDGSARPSDKIPQRQGWPYAFSPHRWIFYVDGSTHVKFSGGSYANHGRFACWASGQFLVGAIAGYIHAFFPMLFPTVCEGVAIELGGLIINRRKLRNLVAQEKASEVGQEGGASRPDEVALVNPDNLSDYFSADFQKRFEKADAAAAKDQDVGELEAQGTASNKEGLTLLSEGRVKVQVGPGMEKQFL